VSACSWTIFWPQWRFLCTSIIQTPRPFWRTFIGAAVPAHFRPRDGSVTSTCLSSHPACAPVQERNYCTMDTNDNGAVTYTSARVSSVHNQFCMDLAVPHLYYGSLGFDETHRTACKRITWRSKVSVGTSGDIASDCWWVSPDGCSRRGVTRAPHQRHHTVPSCSSCPLSLELLGRYSCACSRRNGLQRPDLYKCHRARSGR
jgi:hypothetical protein